MELLKWPRPFFLGHALFLSEVLPSDATVSIEPVDLEGCLTSQNVRNGHIMGGQ